MGLAVKNKKAGEKDYFVSHLERKKLLSNDIERNKEKSTVNSWEFCSAEIRKQSKKALALPKMWTDQLQWTDKLPWTFLEKIVSSALGSVNACHLGILVISEVLMGACSCVSKQDRFHAKTIKSLKKYWFYKTSQMRWRELCAVSV